MGSKKWKVGSGPSNSRILQVPFQRRFDYTRWPTTRCPIYDALPAEQQKYNIQTLPPVVRIETRDSKDKFVSAVEGILLVRRDSNKGTHDPNRMDDYYTTNKTYCLLVKESKKKDKVYLKSYDLPQSQIADIQRAYKAQTK